MKPLVNFSLVPVERVPAWENPRTGKKSLHWYGLTDGQYWIQAEEHSLFEYSEYYRTKNGCTRYCDYQVALLHEDLLKKLPYFLEPVPPSLIPYLSGDSARAWYETYEAWYAQSELRYEEDRFWEISGDATDWLTPRRLDTMHLGNGGHISIWSDAEVVHIEWDNTGLLLDDYPVWSTVCGSFQLPRADFRQEVISFHTRLINQMAERVEKVLAGVLPAEVNVDLDALQREQAERSTDLDKTLAQLELPTDWTRVSRAISEIEQEMAHRK